MNSSKRLPLVCSLLATLLGAAGVHAATITVTSTADSGAGTLRQALASAANGDTINATGVSGTILLTSGELVVSNSVTITGPGPGSLAVNGNAAGRAFRITNAVTVAISSLTITNATTVNLGGGIYNCNSTLTVSNCTISGNSGNYGGGICNGNWGGGATLTIANSTISGNSAGTANGILNNGTATVVNSSVSDNNYAPATLGGGIYNRGTLTVSNCTIRGNECADGPGIYNEGTVTIVNSTFSGNRGGGGGGLCHEGGNATVSNCTFSGNSVVAWGGGGIGNLGTLWVANSTFSGNSAVNGGGICNLSGTLTVSKCTFSGNSAMNGGGICNGSPWGDRGTLEIGDTILNAGASGANITNNLGTITSDGYNLSSDGGGGFLTATGDQINTDPLLGPLQDNGGPTFTHALLAGSPAIDKGKRNAIPALASNTDQRGLPRPVDDPAIANAAGGDGSDIGAFEEQLLLTGVQATSATQMKAIIQWTSDQLANSIVLYGTSRSTVTNVVSVAGNATSHSVRLNALAPGTVYYYEVVSGSLTNNNAGAYYTFTTTTPCPCQ